MLGDAGVAGVHVGHDFPAWLRAVLQQVTDHVIACAVAEGGHGHLGFGAPVLDWWMRFSRHVFILHHSCQQGKSDPLTI